MTSQARSAIGPPRARRSSTIRVAASQTARAGPTSSPTSAWAVATSEGSVAISAVASSTALASPVVALAASSSSARTRAAAAGICSASVAPGGLELGGGACGGAPPHAPPPSSSQPGATDAEQIPAAAARVRAELEEAAKATTGEARAVLEATALMATDPSLVATAQALVGEDVGPARAVWEAATRIVDDLRALGGPMAERAWDVIDVRDRVVPALTGRSRPGVPDPGHPYVLVATDLSPVDVAMLDPARTRGIVTTRGGPVSHTAILARALGIPAVVGVHGAARLTEGTLVVVDGGAG